MIAPAYQYPFLPQMMPLWHVMIFILGTCIGSFLNVCIWRIPRGESVVSPPSRCPKCGHQLPWYENIPLISWLCLGGKCSGCKSPITSRYFFVELLTGVMFFLLWYRIVHDNQPLSLAIVFLPLTALIITTTFIDIEHFIIPNLTTYPMIVFGLAAAFLFPANWGVENGFIALLYSGIALVVSGGLMALFALAGRAIFKRDALGWGDVKYIAAVGACIGLKACFFSVLFGSLTGALLGLGMIIARKGKMKTALPFGPFLAAGTYIWMFYGERLMYLYEMLFKNMQV